MKTISKETAIALGAIVIVLGMFILFGVNVDQTDGAITSFEECVEAGNPVMESYPRQCRTDDGKLFVEVLTDEDGNEIATDPALREFIDAVREETIQEVGQPIEGFEPFMFMQAFPGLVAEDFNGVDALIGGYQIEDGEVVYDLMGEEEIHSAARAISDEGMETHLVNVAERLDIDLEEASIEDVIEAMNQK